MHYRTQTKGKECAKTKGRMCTRRKEDANKEERECAHLKKKKQWTNQCSPSSFASSCGIRMEV